MSPRSLHVTTSSRTVSRLRGGLTTGSPSWSLRRRYDRPGPACHAVRAVEAGELELPIPGAGDTAGRFDALMADTRHDVALGRLVEAHADAVAILAEAGRPARPGALYGVWAADYDGSRVVANDTEEDGDSTAAGPGARAPVFMDRGPRHHRATPIRFPLALRDPRRRTRPHAGPNLVARAGTRRHHHVDDDLRRGRGTRRLPSSARRASTPDTPRASGTAR